MSIRIFSALFIVIFLMGAVPLLLVEPSGAASAGLAAGFMLPVTNVFHVLAFVATGLLASWLGKETIVLLPLCALLMLAIGAMMQVDDHALPAVRDFIVGSIVLFALSVSLLRNKAHLLSIPPVAVGFYFAGGGYMSAVPSISTPLYFLLGTVISAALLLAIGVTMGITLTEFIEDSVGRLKTFPAVSSFLSFF